MINAAKVKDGIVKRGSTWSYVVRVPDLDTGKTKQRWVGGFSSREEAKAARDDARVSARTGSFVDKNTVTVTTYLHSWLDAHAIQIKPSTLHSYKQKVETYIIPAIGKMKLQDVRPMTLTRMYKDLLDHGGRNGASLSPRSVEFVHAILRRALADAVKVERLIPSNPAEAAKRPRPQRHEPVVWTPDELAAFLQVAQKHRLGTLFTLAAYTGARRGELMHLRWSNFDLDGATVTFAGTASVIDKTRVEGTPKSGRSRTVDLDQGTVKAMREHRKAQLVEKLRLGPDYVDSGYVFTQQSGEPIHPDTPSTLMPEFCTTAKVRRVRFHDIRHAHATILLANGQPLHVVAERLGHRDAMVTATVYAHVLSTQASDAADVFADAILNA